MLELKDVKHIADLARLELSAAEEESYQAQLSAILDYVDLLNEADTSAVTPTVAVGKLSNVWRSDAVSPWPEEEVKMALAGSELEAGLVKVKRVL
ncbi:MAG: Asp-tRNA(Asn)/Glu-tRNA(Gln) amidotransferase subunit GatC [Patescibacteria group bacterium]|jgi:aspartyl-tRNA(Asn)/glutamyl-tRNA(Gln) amidotransferase subunit C